LGHSSSSHECIGKSVAGNSTKIHILSDSHGNPIEFVLSEGQIHDSKEIRKAIADKRIQAIIPKKINAVDKTNIGFDKFLYKIRHLAENLFARLKHYRSIATRYEKKTINFSSLIFIACIIIWSKF
jgi:transposase